MDIEVRRQAVTDLKSRLWHDICPVKDISEKKSFWKDRTFDYRRQRGKNEDIFEKAYPEVSVFWSVSDRPNEIVVDIPATYFEKNPAALSWIIAGGFWLGVCFCCGVLILNLRRLKIQSGHRTTSEDPDEQFELT